MDPIDVAAEAEEAYKADKGRVALEAAATQKAIEQREAAERAARGPAVTVSDDGMSIELRTTTPRLCWTSPRGVTLLVVIVACLGGAVALLVTMPEHAAEAENAAALEDGVLLALHYIGAGLSVALALRLCVFWYCLGHTATIGVRVTAAGNAGLLRRARVIDTCPPSEIRFEVIDRAVVWGRDRWVGKCRITSANTWSNANRVFGLNEADIARVARFAKVHGAKSYRENYGSTGGSQNTYTDRGLYST